MAGQIVTLSPKAIIVSGLQVRVEMDRAHVDDLKDLFDEENPTWPDGLPPVVVFHDGKSYFLADGHHRLDGAVQAGCQEIRVEIHKGTMKDALIFACGANASHGLKRTAADKRRAVAIARQVYPDSPARAVARLCKVSHEFVSKIDREAKKPAATKDETEPASAVNIDNKDNGSSNYDREEKDTQGEPSAALATEPAPETPAATDGDLNRAATDADFGELVDSLNRAALLIDRIAHSPGGEMLRSHYLKTKSTNGTERLYSPDLENLRRELKHWRPRAWICPACRGVPNQSCNLCFGLPYITRGVWERLSEEQKAKLERGENDAA